MPRSARLDAPGVLHHIMIRGIERVPLSGRDSIWTKSPGERQKYLPLM